ncbi:MAG: endonuclease [Chitinophagaceae bacterium]|nr:endonuclease [Chitinophagaceae bacterium]
MPEGPSIVILKEAVQSFTGKKVIAATGNSRIEQSRLIDQKIIAFKSWGKHFLICFKTFSVRIHLLMFGSYQLNEKKPGKPVRLNLTFKKGEINFYSCAIKYLEGDVNTHYDWSSDVMNPNWDPKKAKGKLKNQAELLVCDALLEQDIFAGVGNIIKNEVLYRVRVHPESIVNKLPAYKLKKLLDEVSIYSFQFLEWKKKYELKKHWLVYAKKKCVRCNYPIIKKYTGLKKRRSFICTNCQVLYD